MGKDYNREFWKALAAQPVRQSARFAMFQGRWLTLRRLADAQLLRMARRAGCSVVPTPRLLRPPSHHYQGYSGPWIEDFFFRYWLRDKYQTDLAYLPVFWTDLYLHAQTHRFTPRQNLVFNSMIRDFLDYKLTDKCYFTLLEYDHMIWDWHRFPRNVVVFSAGGWGDIPVPLLKGSPPFQCPPKNIRVSFVGRVDGASDATGVRMRMQSALKDFALFTSGIGWRDVMARSTFSLCPRGLGRASFRLYEALSVGSIPIYIWDDIEWLPYRDQIDWSEIAISINVTDLEQLPEIIAGYTAERISSMQTRIGSLYQDYFTLPGVCRQIVCQVELLSDRARFAELMKQRAYLPGTTSVRPMPTFLLDE